MLRKKLRVLLGAAMMLAISVGTFSGVASAATCAEGQDCPSPPPVELKTSNDVGIKNADYRAYRGLGNQTEKSQGTPSLKARH
jgi:hypothetical protein